jgi:autotransporter-associated beta strand protein
VINSSFGVKDYTISGVLSGATTVTKNGSSRLTLTGTNTYSGITNVNAGILNIQNNSALGTTANGTVVASGARLQLENNITVTGESLTLNGDPTKVSAVGGTMATIHGKSRSTKTLC